MVAIGAKRTNKGASDYELPLDFVVLAAVTIVLIAIATKMYGRMGY
jgi:hypothetical protein